MGNCLVRQEKLIKVMKTDGKVLEYKSPIKVQQVLSDFAGHAISDTLSVVRYLRPDSDLIGGHLYYLLPLPVVVPEVEKTKRVRFANPEVLEDSKGSGVVMRIKLVMSKQELEMMLRKGGISVEDMVSQVQKKQSTDQNNDHKNENNEDGDGSCKGWKPVLEGIPELS